jgi:hemerythrin-like domain-containing protein
LQDGGHAVLGEVALASSLDRRGVVALDQSDPAVGATQVVAVKRLSVSMSSFAYGVPCGGVEMKRSEALQTLSRDHHRGLYVALRLRRATAATAVEARHAFLEFWQADGRRHFRVEEEVLLPAYARRGPADEPAVVRVLTEHVDLRRRGAELETSESPVLSDLRELGQRLERHIRHEERVLFPLIERALPDAELAELALALERAEASC